MLLIILRKNALADFGGFDMHSAMKKQSKATVKTPVEKLKKSKTIEHYNAVLLEDIKSKMEFVIEGMKSTKDSIKKDVGGLEIKLTQEIELLKSVVHKHSSDIEWEAKTHEMLRNNIKECTLQIVDNNKRIETMQGRLLNEINQTETRLSTKIDKIGNRIGDHEGRIVILEKNQIAHS
jgi:hypothetical protein